MKRLNLFLWVAALLAVVMTVSPVASAQENGNRDEFGKTVRGPYETNRFGDNWFVGAGGGINVLWNKGCDMAIGPSIDAGVGKWFTPSVGVRLGYQGYKSRIWTSSANALDLTTDTDRGMYLNRLGYMYFHGDFLWNISNAVGGYKEMRIWNPVPYLHAGYYRSYGVNGVEFADDELAAGAGLLQNFRLTDRLDLIIDMRATVVNGRVSASSGPAVIGSVTAGMAVDLGWPGFVRTSNVLGAAAVEAAERIAALEAAAVALEVANDALASENYSLLISNKELSDKLCKMKDVQSTPADLLEFFKGITPAVYFEIGQTELSPQELQHLECIAETIVASAADIPSLVLTVMGSADSETGSEDRNRELSEKRGEYVFDLLTGKYGIDKNRISLESEVVSGSDELVLARSVVFRY